MYRAFTQSMVLPRVHHVFDMAGYRAVTVFHFLRLAPAIIPSTVAIVPILKCLLDELFTLRAPEAKLFVGKAKRGAIYK